MNTYTFRQVLAIRGIRRLWTGQLVSVAGDFLAIFAVISIASFRMHGTPAQITGVTISYMLPLAIFGPVAGVFVDRWNPRYAMIASDVTRALLALLLLLATQPGEIYAILFALSTVSTFFIPAQSVLVRTLVPGEALLAVNGVMQQSLLILRMLSPALAGALVAQFGPGSCFLLDTLSFLFSAIMLRGVLAVRPPAVRGITCTRGVLSDLSAGIRFILTQPGIAFVMLAMASATFAISCFSPLIAILVRDVLRADVRIYGAISAMIGLGMIAGTQCVRRLAPRPPVSSCLLRHIVLGSLGVIACGILLMGATGSAMATGAGAFVMGGGVGLLMAPAQTLIQSETPLPMAGRVSSGVMSLVSAAQIAGLVLSGVLAGVIGLRPLLFTSAAIPGGLALAGCWKLRGRINRSLATPADRRQKTIACPTITSPRARAEKLHRRAGPEIQV